ncbi:AraC family transcriptional regulator [Actinomadura craniellae]|uniref:AraC family transcriptional regulator n=1 Tax=Actinomadura craniellae TaxID=2231787 RepID=A0A365HAD0_9ACTN|nr:helix-turn-helix domain-containing protein [Actinomadura craniellae]RAY16055.1 AraC family transcriptional regulator [Actinomadura craniellae]
MAEGTLGSTRGILRPQRGLERFRLSRREPAADLAPFVENIWILNWDLVGQEPHRQQVLTHPAVHLTFTTGGRAHVAGVVRGVFTETIEERGRVVGMRFRPGGFRPFLGGPVSDLTDRFVPVPDLFGPEGRAAGDAILATEDTDTAVLLLEDFLRTRRPEPDPMVDEVAAIVAEIGADPSIVRVDGLAAELGVGVRWLQRLFGEYVGVGPKWVIRRYRMHEAADRVARGRELDWPALAAELGFSDQAHFVREFTATVGVSPTRYARDCADKVGS